MFLKSVNWKEWNYAILSNLCCWYLATFQSWQTSKFLNQYSLSSWLGHVRGQDHVRHQESCSKMFGSDNRIHGETRKVWMMFIALFVLSLTYCIIHLSGALYVTMQYYRPEKPVFLIFSRPTVSLQALRMADLANHAALTYDMYVIHSSHMTDCNKFPRHHCFGCHAMQDASR